MRDGTEELNCTIKQADERNSSTDYYAKQLKNIHSVQYIQNYTQTQLYLIDNNKCQINGQSISSGYNRVKI